MSCKAVRQGVADAVTAAGLPAFAMAPDRPAPPFAAVIPDEPYLSEQATMNGNTFEMTLVIRVVVRNGTNEAVMDALDDAVENIIVALRPQQWSTSVGSPYALLIGNTEYPVIDVTIRNYVDIN